MHLWRHIFTLNAVCFSFFLQLTQQIVIVEQHNNLTGASIGVGYSAQPLYAVPNLKYTQQTSVYQFQIIRCGSLIIRPRERLRSIVMSTSLCVSVCLYVCLSVCLSVREDISGITARSLPNFLCMLPMAVARFSNGVVAIRYVLPVFVDDIMLFL